MAIKQIVCSGTPYEVHPDFKFKCNSILSYSPRQIGHKHGSQAAPEIERAIIFYAKMFAKHSKLDWAQVQDLARDFDGLIRDKWPRYYEELQGASCTPYNV